MIKAEWTSNDALSTGQTTHSNAHNTLNALDCVSRQYAIEHYQHVCRRTACKECPLHIQVTDTLTDCELELFLHNLPSAQPEIIRCEDCIYYDPPHVENDGMRLEYADLPKEAFDVLGTGLVTLDYGINVGGRCTRDYNAGYNEDKRVFVPYDNFCGRAERRE